MRGRLIGRSRGALWAIAVALASGCPGPTPTGVDATHRIDAGGGGSDRAGVGDGAAGDRSGRDGGHDAALIDSGVAADRPAGDQRTSDLGAVDRSVGDSGGGDRSAGDGAAWDRRTDDAGCGVGCDAGSGQDRGPTGDVGWRIDASGIDASGLAGVGQSCDSAPCIPGTTCLGNSRDGYFCRRNCALGGTDCDVASERCVWFAYNDGGIAPYGGCTPGVGYSAPCWWDGGSAFCAELYVCIAPSGTFDYRCRARCVVGAVDAGCPIDAPRCARITNMDGGACLPRG